MIRKEILAEGDAAREMAAGMLNGPSAAHVIRIERQRGFVMAGSVRMAEKITYVFDDGQEPRIEAAFTTEGVKIGG